MRYGLNLEYVFQTGGGDAEIEPSCDFCCCEINGKIWEPVLKKRGLSREGVAGEGTCLNWNARGGKKKQ